MTVGIYRIGLADGRCYVGQSGDIESRWAGHRCDLRKGRHHSPYLQRVWDKYGEGALIFEVLEECALGALTARERAWMDALSSVFNVCPAAGSGRGWNHTPESIAKISATLKGRAKSPEMRARLSASLMGHSVSAEARAKMSAYHRNRPAEVRARMSAAASKRRPITPETRAKLSAASKGRAVSAESRAKRSATLKARFAANPRPPLTAEHRENIGAGVRAYLASQEPPTHCRNGHPLDDEDAYYVDRSGRRTCRMCALASARRYRARKQQAEGNGT